MFCAAHGDNRALALAAGRMLGVLPCASGVEWDRAWECCWPLVLRLRGEIREGGMLGQQGPIKDQVDSFCLKESSNNIKRLNDIRTGALVGKNSSLNIQN